MPFGLCFLSAVILIKFTPLTANIIENISVVNESIETFVTGRKTEGKKVNYIIWFKFFIVNSVDSTDSHYYGWFRGKWNKIQIQNWLYVFVSLLWKSILRDYKISNVVLLYLNNAMEFPTTKRNEINKLNFRIISDFRADGKVMGWILHIIFFLDVKSN